MAAASTHYMYVLECADGSLYTGYAVDVQARLAVHNAGKGAKYTRARLPVSLLAYAEFATKHDAMHAQNTSSSSFPATKRTPCSPPPPTQPSRRP